MSASLVYPSAAVMVIRPIATEGSPAREWYWHQRVATILLLILKIVVFASIVLWPWETVG